MLLSEIGDKEIIDISKGSMHGRLWDAEMLFDQTTGVIHSLSVPDFQGSKSRYKEDLQLPWSSIIIVGEDTIIFKSRQVRNHMKSSGKHIHKALSFLLAVTMITGLLFISGCGNDMPAADGNDTDAPYKTAAEEFFLDRGDGTYTLTEAVYPKDYDGPMPLVAIAHGFKGTLNSGGFDFKAVALVAPAGTDDAMVYYMGGDESWEEMKKTAREDGFIEHQGQKLTPEWFKEFEDYNPCDFGYKFGDKPVLVICNTLDYVLTDETSRKCAAAYKNSRVIEVTTYNYHVYEMSYENSELKDYLMSELIDFFKDNLQ